MDNDELKQEEQTSAPEEKHSPKAEGKKEKSRISELEKEVEKLTSERDKAKETMLRNLAELENFRKRTAREKEDILKYSNTKLLEHFLEIPDTLSAATIQGRKSTDYAALLKGLDLIHEKTTALFKSEGVEKMDTESGAEFNVDLMEAVMMQPSPDIPEGKILAVITPGYMYYDKVLRHAKVIVSAGAPQQGPQKEDAEAE